MLIDTLHGIAQGRKHYKKETYREILKLAKERVVFYAKGRGGGEKGMQFCIYTVPVWLPNRPLYNSEKASKYVLRKLTAEGLYVSNITPNQLYISWGLPAAKEKSDNRQTALLGLL